MPPKRAPNGSKSNPTFSPPKTRRATGRNNELTESEKASAKEADRQAKAQEQRKKEAQKEAQQKEAQQKEAQQKKAQQQAQRKAQEQQDRVENDALAWSTAKMQEDQRKNEAMFRAIQEANKNAREVAADLAQGNKKLATKGKRVTLEPLKQVRQRWGPPSDVQTRVIQNKAVEATRKKAQRERPTQQNIATGQPSSDNDTSDNDSYESYDEEIDRREEENLQYNQEALFMYEVKAVLKERRRGNTAVAVWNKRIGSESWLCGDFDTTILADQVFQAIDQFKMDEDQVSYAAVVRSDHSRARPSTVTLLDFSPEQWVDVVELELKNQWKKYQRALEVDIVVTGTIPTVAKRSAIAITSPGNSPSSRRTRTTQQVEALAEQRDRNEAVGNKNNELITRWKCRDERCINESGFCFVAPFSDDHYALSPVQTKHWATAIHLRQDDASLTQPPTPLYRDLMTKQGPVGVNWKHPIQKQKRDEKKSILDTYLESQNTLLQIQMSKEMANSLGSSSQCRNQHIQPPPPPPPPQYSYYQHPPPPQPYFAPSQQPHYGPPSQQYHPYSQPPPSPPRGVASPQVAPPPAPPTAPAAPPSSPIATDRNEEEQVMNDFWDWKLRRAGREERKQLLARARAIIEDQMWTIDHLKRMNDTSSTLYRRAIDLGLPDGLITGLKEDLRDFKRVYREQYLPARNLAGLGGGFIEGDPMG